VSPGHTCDIPGDRHPRGERPIWPQRHPPRHFWHLLSLRSIRIGVSQGHTCDIPRDRHPRGGAYEMAPKTLTPLALAPRSTLRWSGVGGPVCRARRRRAGSRDELVALRGVVPGDRVGRVGAATDVVAHHVEAQALLGVEEEVAHVVQLVLGVAPDPVGEPASKSRGHPIHPSRFLRAQKRTAGWCSRKDSSLVL